MPDWLSRLRALFRRNRAGKLAALVLATATWYGIQSVINFEARLREVPVALRLPEGWSILDRTASTVDIAFRGSEQDIRFLNREQVKVEVDLRQRVLNETSLTARVKILPKHVIAPNTVRPVQVRPDEIIVSLDRREQKTLPVKADLQGDVMDAYEVERWVYMPAVLTVTGPRSRLVAMEAISTAPIDIEGRTKSFRKPRVAVALPPEILMADPTAPYVAVDITISERTAAETWTNVPVSVLAAPGVREPLALEPAHVSLTVRGRAEVLKKLNALDVRVYADGSSIEKAGAYDLPVRVHLPPGVTQVGIDPAVIKVTRSER